VENSKINMNFLKKLFNKSKIQTGANNSILRQKAKEVEKITPAVLDIVKKITEIIGENRYQTPGLINIGLAASQISQSLRIIAFREWPAQNIIVLINPRITRQSKNRIVMEESCLSLPGIVVLVERAARTTVQGLDINGRKIEIRAKGFLARMIQHEIDHLDGILITDYA